MKIKKIKKECLLEIIILILGIEHESVFHPFIAHVGVYVLYVLLP